MTPEFYRTSLEKSRENNPRPSRRPRTRMSGLDAVKKIVETEGQARRTVEEAKTRGEQVVARAHEEADIIRKEFVSSAQQKREEILATSREKAEAEARQSDAETDKLLLSYRRLSDERKADATAKAVDLVLNS